jgi:hypothetical protein
LQPLPIPAHSFFLNPYLLILGIQLA